MKDVIDFGHLPVEAFPRKTALLEEMKALAYVYDQEDDALVLNTNVTCDQNYWSMSGINDAHAAHLKDIADDAMGYLKIPLHDDDVVLDIGCNDGTLLQGYPDFLRRVGIDPAKKIRALSCDMHIREPFSAKIFDEEVGEKAKIITLIGVLQCVENPLQMLVDVEKILEDKGVLVTEFPYFPKLLENHAFDAFNFEMKRLFTRSGFKKLVEKAGLTVTRSQLVGENLRCFIEKRGESDSTADLPIGSLQALRSQMEVVKNDLVTFLKKAKAEKKNVMGYGASSRGNTLLSCCGIGPDLLPCIADRNPIKWGRFTSTGIPIISEEEARSKSPDYFLALPYRYIDAFMQREHAFILSGGKFVVPLPTLTEFP